MKEKAGRTKQNIKKVQMILFLVATFTFLFGFQASAASKTENVKITGTCSYSGAYEMLDLMNQEREAVGLSALTMDADLMNAAMQRAAETCIYASHTRPSGQSCFSISSKSCAENFECSYPGTASMAMKDLMNSSGHRANILGSDFRSVGIGCFTQGRLVYWVQIFGTSSPVKASQPVDVKKTFTVTIAADTFKQNFMMFDSKDFKLLVGEKETLEAAIINPAIGADYAELENSSFNWESSSSAATVNSKGVVTGKSSGSATITASGKSGYLLTSQKLTISPNLSTSISSLTNTSKGIKIKWKAAPSAKGYYVYRKASSGSYKKIKTIKNGKTTSYTDTAVKNKNGKTYTYKIVAYSGSKTGAKATKKTVRLTGTKLSSVRSNSSKKMTVKWKKATGVTGYQVQYSTSKNFPSGSKTKSKTVSGASKVSNTFSSLKKGKTYYVRVRSYKKVSGKKYYSAWTSRKKVKVK